MKQIEEITIQIIFPILFSIVSEFINTTSAPSQPNSEHIPAIVKHNANKESQIKVKAVYFMKNVNWAIL